MKKKFYKKIYLFIAVSTYATVIYAIPPFTLGIENMSQDIIKKISTHPNKPIYSVGLITNQTGIDQKGKRNIDIIINHGMKLQYIFTPEHGFYGTFDEHTVFDSIDKKTNIPIISLYKQGTGTIISSDHMNKIDCLVFDIQDSGMRHYTYISTLLNTMKMAAQYNKPFLILDRPNPLGGAMEGPLVEPQLISFISIAPIPLRHGMTVGELASYFNQHVLEKPALLHVVPMQGYNRTQGYIGNLRKELSPNLQSLQSCYGYSFLGLLGEIEPFDIGIGTQMAFRCITLPESLPISQSLWNKIEKMLTNYGIKTNPYMHTNKKTKKTNKGLKLHFNDINNQHSFDLFIDLLQMCKAEGVDLSFSASFDKAIGTTKLKKVIVGTLSREIFTQNTNEDLKKFYERARKFFLYKPFPHIHSSPENKK